MSRREDWPQEIRKPVQLANFRPSAAERWYAKPRKSYRATRTGMSDEHLAAIRQLACAFCPISYGTECHHLKSGPAHAERSFGRRATDRWTIPICRIHHNAIERAGSRGEAAYARSYATDIVGLALALWNVSPDVERMREVLKAHKQGAIRQLSEEDRQRRAERNG
jgi:hypothetical protein